LSSIDSLEGNWKVSARQRSNLTRCALYREYPRAGPREFPPNLGVDTTFDGNAEPTEKLRGTEASGIHSETAKIIEGAGAIRKGRTTLDSRVVASPALKVCIENPALALTTDWMMAGRCNQSSVNNSAR
jgi:hypothetical protein